MEIKERAILHSDANCFYASCEMVLNPELRGKAVAVCGLAEERHGIVLAKSELAKRAGVKTGMPNGEAKALCPDLIIVPPHFEYYEKFSRLLHKIYERYTDYIEPYGLDECWLDVTDSIKKPMEIAEEIRESVKRELGLTVSIGVSFNKVFAKLGSDMKKPDAITEITKENFKEKVFPLPVSDLLYCGRRTSEELARVGVFTIGTLASLPSDYMQRKFGKNGHSLWLFANGLDNSSVAHMDYHPPQKSLGHGITCVTNLETLDEANKVIFSLCQDIGYKLRAMKLCALGVSLTVKNEHLASVSYQERLDARTQDELKIARVAFELLKRNYVFSASIRALSVTAINLEPIEVGEQLSLFDDLDKQEKRTRLSETVDQIKNEFGMNAIRPAVVLDERKMPSRQGFKLPGAMHK